MKKRILALMILFLSSALFADKPKVTWVYMKDAEPINWVDESTGKPMGLEVEIIQHIMDKLGIEVEHKFYPWARAQKMVETGKADGMMTTPNGSRWEYALYGKEAALVNYWNIFVHKDNKELIEKAKKI